MPRSAIGGLWGGRWCRSDLKRGSNGGMICKYILTMCNDRRVRGEGSLGPGVGLAGKFFES